MKDYARHHYRDILGDALGTKLPHIDKATLKRKIAEKFDTGTKRVFARLGATTLSIDEVRPSTVFEAYSGGTGFFAGEGKKHQFPDAFIFERLRVLATKDVPLIIVSADGDFAGPVKDEPQITLVKSLPELFKLLGLEVEAPEIQQFLDDHEEEVVGLFDAELSNWGLEVADVPEAEIDEASVTQVQLADLITFRWTKDSGSILAVDTATVTAKVSYTHPDWDTASWDSDDKVAIPWREVSGETDVNFDVRFSMLVSVDKSANPVAVEELQFLDDDFVYVDIQQYETYK